MHVLCYARGEASTLNSTGTDLHRAREQELRQASAMLGVATVAPLGYPDGRLASVPVGELAAHASRRAAGHHAEGLLVFDDTGVTGHPDHRAVTRAAVRAALAAGLPVLAWALPAAVAGRLQEENRSAVCRAAAGASRLVRSRGPCAAAPGGPGAREPDLAEDAPLDTPMGIVD